jgi:predicted PurR-regulated permease PerM
VTGGIMGSVAAGGKFVVGAATTIALTPLVAFFMMVEWPRIVAWVEGLYPRQHAALIGNLLTKIDTKVAGFIRGQITVAFILGLIYALALAIAGLNYGFLIGICAGILSIIPLVGSTLGLVVSVVIAWFQTGDLVYTGIIAAIFLTGQFIEGNFLSPKIVGDSVGLHPLWIIFALLAGGSLFGIVGMLIAVPVAAVIGVLSGFAIERYKASPLYQRASEEKAVLTMTEGKDS